MSTTVWIILTGAVVTYLTRAGGHLVLSRFQRIHPRVEAGLNAVPAAVLTTLFAPAVAAGGPAEIAAIVVAALVHLATGGLMAMFLAGAAVLVVLRMLIG
ncbi:MAG: AzlD family protein [Rhizobiaceae bacterium]